jgi:hypothetical protein
MSVESLSLTSFDRFSQSSMASWQSALQNISIETVVVLPRCRRSFVRRDECGDAAFSPSVSSSPDAASELAHRHRHHDCHPCRCRDRRGCPLLLLDALASSLDDRRDRRYPNPHPSVYRRPPNLRCRQGCRTGPWRRARCTRPPQTIQHRQQGGNNSSGMRILSSSCPGCHRCLRLSIIIGRRRFKIAQLVHDPCPCNAQQLQPSHTAFDDAKLHVCMVHGFGHLNLSNVTVT